MGEIIDLIAKIKKYYRFTKSEIKGIVITILVLAFVISFRSWGANEVNVAAGFFNLLVAIIVVGFSFLLHDFAVKAASLSIGHRAEYKMWIFGLILAVILAFATNGKFWFLIPGGIIVHHLAGHRLGFFRYGINYGGLGLACFAGPLANIILAIILKSLESFVNSPYLHQAVIFNIIFAIYMILPIPPADGSRLFYGSRMIYILCLVFIIAAAVLLLVNVPIAVVIIGSVVLALVGWLLYYIFLERVWWKGPYPK